MPNNFPANEIQNITHITIPNMLMTALAGDRCEVISVMGDKKKISAIR